MAKVTSAELAQDVDAAEKLISRHEEHRAEISSRQDTLKRFYATGNDLIRQVGGVRSLLRGLSGSFSVPPSDFVMKCRVTSWGTIYKRRYVSWSSATTC